MKEMMEINKETASRLWVQQFGKRQKAYDFSGREIAKAAYNDRNSAYGWNVDHILPQSRGGKTADYNLVCCHILTNDEKADKFPCFKANAKEFEIRKRQNHYEILARTIGQADGEETINFLDAAQGLKYWKQCKSCNENVFVGYVKVRVETSNETAGESEQFFGRYGKFLSGLFVTESVFAENTNRYVNLNPMCGSNQTCIFTVIVGTIPTPKDTQNFLDDCIILNTYNGYFMRKNIFKSIQIICGMKCYDDYLNLSLKCKEGIVDKKVQFFSTMMIDDLVKSNSDAKGKLQGAFIQNGFYPYNYVFRNLEEVLAKRI